MKQQGAIQLISAAPSGGGAILLEENQVSRRALRDPRRREIMPHIQLLVIQDESRREATMIRIRGIMKSDEILNALPDDLLEQIAGGLDKFEESLVRAAITSMKNEGYSMEGALEVLVDGKYPDVSKEITDYVTQNWDLV
jgi:hypothetical protein